MFNKCQDLSSKNGVFSLSPPLVVVARLNFSSSVNKSQPAKHLYFSIFHITFFRLVAFASLPKFSSEKVSAGRRLFVRSFSQLVLCNFPAFIIFSQSAVIPLIWINPIVIVFAPFHLICLYCSCIIPIFEIRTCFYCGSWKYFFIRLQKSEENPKPAAKWLRPTSTLDLPIRAILASKSSFKFYHLIVIDYSIALRVN